MTKKDDTAFSSDRTNFQSDTLKYMNNACALKIEDEEDDDIFSRSIHTTFQVLGSHQNVPCYEHEQYTAT